MIFDFFSVPSRNLKARQDMKAKTGLDYISELIHSRYVVFFFGILNGCDRWCRDRFLKRNATNRRRKVPFCIELLKIALKTEESETQELNYDRLLCACQFRSFYRQLSLVERMR
jgi:hypothetical protein